MSVEIPVVGVSAETCYKLDGENRYKKQTCHAVDLLHSEDYMAESEIIVNRIPIVMG